MIRASTGPGGDQLRFTLIVAYDPIDGRIYGTSLHGSLGDDDREGIRQSETRLLETLRQRAGDSSIEIETVVLPASELGDLAIARIDLATKTIVPFEGDQALL